MGKGQAFRPTSSLGDWVTSAALQQHYCLQQFATVCNCLQAESAEAKLQEGEEESEQQGEGVQEVGSHTQSQSNVGGASVVAELQWAEAAKGVEGAGQAAAPAPSREPATVRSLRRRLCQQVELMLFIHDQLSAVQCRPKSSWRRCMRCLLACTPSLLAPIPVTSALPCLVLQARDVLLAVQAQAHFARTRERLLFQNATGLGTELPGDGPAAAHGTRSSTATQHFLDGGGAAAAPQLTEPGAYTGGREWEAQLLVAPRLSPGETSLAPF